MIIWIFFCETTVLWKVRSMMMVISYHLQVLPEVCVDCVVVLELL